MDWWSGRVWVIWVIPQYCMHIILANHRSDTCDWLSFSLYRFHWPSELWTCIVWVSHSPQFTE